MKMFNMGLVAAIGALALLATGCDSNDGDTTPITDTSDAQAEVEDDTVEDDTVEDDTVEDDTTGDVTDDTVQPAGACTNAADLAIVSTENVNGTASSCGLGCLGEADERQCSITCIQQTHTITDECAGCYGDIVACTITNCVGECAADPSAAVCTQCQQDAGCTAAFYECTGLTPPSE